MKKAILAAMLLLPLPSFSFEKVQLTGSEAYVMFSPREDAQEMLVKRIGMAEKQILVQAYGYTSAPVVNALIKAKQRGVDVRVILDKSNEHSKYSKARVTMKAGIPVVIDYKPQIAHNKVMIFDHVSVATGSFNFSGAAQNSNAENLIIIEDNPELAKIYTDNWNKRLKESRPWKSM